MGKSVIQGGGENIVKIEKMTRTKYFLIKKLHLVSNFYEIGQQLEEKAKK